MGRGAQVVATFLVFFVLADGFHLSFASPPAPAKIFRRLVSSALSAILNWLWSLKSIATIKSSAISGRPMMRFESGYSVKTVFDGSKLGIEPFAVEVAPSGELLVLDSVNSNIYRISSPLSRYSRPRLVAGSSAGFAGHVDGKLRQARMNHPKGFTVDGRGNIYVADTMNMAIRKISDTGVTTIAGGRWRKGGHVDGPSEDAKFSNDFEVTYVGSSCSLLVVDRGNQAIREIHLSFDDCAYQYGSAFPLGIAVLVAAGFFGYMLALLQYPCRCPGTSGNEPDIISKSTIPPSPYLRSLRSVRPPLIPPDHELEKQEGFITSLGKLIAGTSSSLTEIVGAFSGRKRKPQSYQNQNMLQQQRWPSWPMQESYTIEDEDKPPPPTDARTKTARKTYAFMPRDPEKILHQKQGRSRTYSSTRDDEIQQKQMHQQHLQPQRHHSSGPQTYYGQSCEVTEEIVFGAVQESDSRRSMEIKAVNYGDSIYDQQDLRYRKNYMGHSHDY